MYFKIVNSKDPTDAWSMCVLYVYTLREFFDPDTV